jgi:ribosomal protein S12
MTETQDNLDPLKVPAFMRKKTIVNQTRQKLLWTAWDRKESGVEPNSKRALGKAPRNTAIAANQCVVSKKEPLSIQKKVAKFAAAGEITHFLDKINVSIIKLTARIKEGDLLIIEGADFIFTQQVTQMQVDRQPVKVAKKGSHIGLKTEHPAKIGGKIYLIK